MRIRLELIISIMAGLPKVCDNESTYKSVEDDSDCSEKHSDTLCGCGPCKPASIQRFSHPVIFTGHAGLLISINFCALFYFNGIVTTIERQFKLSSSEVAFLTILNDISILCFILFATYFGERGHRPTWVGCGGLIVALAFVVCSLPHYLSDPVDPQSIISGSTGTKQDLMSDMCSGLPQSNQSTAASSNSTSGDCQDLSSSKGGMGSAKWIIIGQIIWGLGAAPMFPLTLSYIDDAVKKHKFTSYTAFLFIAISLGPMGGFFMTSLATSKYVDFDRIPVDDIPDLQQSDPRWIGAWWFGFPIFSIMMAIAAIPMLFYPKVMRPRQVESQLEEQNEDDDGEEDMLRPMKSGGDIMSLASDGSIFGLIKGLLLTMKRLLCNLPLMLMIFGASAETAIGASTSAFNIKYMQTQFKISPSKAAFLMGGIAVPASTLAQIASGVICRRFKLNSKKCVALVIICHVIGGIGLLSQLAIGCKNPPMAGINTPTLSLENPNTIGSSNENQFQSTCNQECACSDEVFRPVCGEDGISYLSPCHAGCTQFNTTIEGIKKYSNCACVSSMNSGPYNNTAFKGLCPGSCNENRQLYIFVLTIVVLVFCTTLTLSPKVYVTFRLVEANDRAIGLGLKSVITKCIGYFPSPILMGLIINSTCILWQYTCGNQGSCWVYDIVSYRYLYVGTLFAARCITILCFVGLYVCMKPSKEEVLTKADQQEMKTINGKSPGKSKLES